MIMEDDDYVNFCIIDKFADNGGCIDKMEKNEAPFVCDCGERYGKPYNCPYYVRITNAQVKSALSVITAYIQHCRSPQYGYCNCQDCYVRESCNRHQ
jgi:hypothetical protein